MRIGRLRMYLLPGILIAGCMHKPRASASSACLEGRKPSGFQSVLTIVRGRGTTAVEGVVVQRGTDAPLPDAGVWIDPPNGPTTRTGADGRFAFGDVAPGRYAVVMRRIGFESLRDSITVPAGGELRIEAQQSMLDGCDGLGAVRTAN